MSAVTVSDRMRSLGFVGICLVILLHMMRLPNEWWAGGANAITTDQLVANISIVACLGKLAVPLFFVMSGYWLAVAHRARNEQWKQAVVKRVRSLLLPMIIWSVIALAYEALAGRLRVPSAEYWYLPREVNQFWYYRTLFVYVVMSPFFLWLCKNWIVGLAMAGILWLLAFVGCPGQHRYFMWINESAFTFGIVCGLHPSRIADCFSWARSIRWRGLFCSFVSLVVLTTLSAVFRSRILYIRLIYLIIPTGCLVLWKLSPFFAKILGRIKGLYSLNVFIFAVHFVVLWKVGDALTFIGWNRMSVAFMCVQYALILAICVSSGLLIQRFFPGALRFLSGGRG